MICIEKTLLETAAQLAQQDWRTRHALTVPLEPGLSVAWLWPIGAGQLPEAWVMGLAGAAGYQNIDVGAHMQSTPYGDFFQLQRGHRLYMAQWQGDGFGRLFISDRPMPSVQPFRLRGEGQSAWGLVWR